MKGMNCMTKTKKLTEIAVTIALAVICSFIKAWEMPQGGSVALTMVPLLFISQKRGFVVGCITGAIYGVLSAIIAGIIYHPASFLLDYVLAFGAMGLAGLFKSNNIKNITLGTICAVAGRFIVSLISGAVLFGEYAPQGQNSWVYSLIYQASYLIPELIIVTLILIFLYLKAHRLYEI
jgi:thiamine transporter